MKIRIEDEESKHSVELNSENVLCYDVLQDMLDLLKGFGFHPESVKSAVLEIADEYERCKELLKREEE